MPWSYRHIANSSTWQRLRGFMKHNLSRVLGGELEFYGELTEEKAFYGKDCLDTDT